MKQSELDKMLNVALRQSAKAQGWKQSKGYVFKAFEDLFFSASVLGVVKPMRLFYHLDFKPLAFDDLFWKIAKLEANLNKPLSFRASGVWTAPMTRVYEDSIDSKEWDREQLHDSVDKIISEAGVEAKKLSSELQSPEKAIELIEKLYSKHLEIHPNSRKNIWVERLLATILVADYSKAESLVQDRIKIGDGGGFYKETVSFFELAQDYLLTAPK